MDTNTEPQINSFAGGLNSDDDLSVVATNQYIDARNIKISSYRGGEGRDNRHGSLMPVQGVKLAGSFAGESNKVVATGSIRDYGVVVALMKMKIDLRSIVLKTQQAELFMIRTLITYKIVGLLQTHHCYHQMMEKNILMHLIFSLITRAKTISSYTQQIQYIR